MALQALAAGADVNAAYRTPRAHRLVRDTLARDKAPTSPSKKQAAAAAAAAVGQGQDPSNSSGSVSQQYDAGGNSSRQQEEAALAAATAGAATAGAAGGAESEEEQPDAPSSWTACGSVSVLHAAAAAGNRVLLEFLLQNGASWQQTDAGGRSALHYALLHDAVECAKQLMGRGREALAGMRDARGQSGLDLCLAKGRVQDEELFLMLSG